MASREQESTFFSADNSEYAYKLYKYDIKKIIRNIVEEIQLEALNDVVSPDAIKLNNDEDDQVRVDYNNNASVGMGGILNAIEQMQAHFDARLTVLKVTILQHSMRLSRIENMKNG